jgi:hypothetical protein
VQELRQLQDRTLAVRRMHTDGHLGGDPRRHEGRHAGAAQHGADLSCCIRRNWRRPDAAAGCAVAARGDQMNAIPTPSAANGNTSRQIGVDGVISIESQVSAIASTEKPKPTTGAGGIGRRSGRPSVPAHH